MKSSMIYALFVLSAACPLLARPQDQPCGDLGPGKDPCTCSDVVVKAAKLPTPTVYVSPEEINDAAASRSTLIIRPDGPQGYSDSQSTTSDMYSNRNTIVMTNGNSNAYTSSASNAYSGNSQATAYSSSVSNANIGSSQATAYSSSASNANGGNSRASAYSSSASNVNSGSGQAIAYSNSASKVYNANGESSTYSSSASDVYNANGESSAYSNSASEVYNANEESSAYSNSASEVYNANEETSSNGAATSYSDSITYVDNSSGPSSRTIDVTKIDIPEKSSESSGCGCNKAQAASLEVVDDTTVSGDVIVPSFPPIGDLCYPLPINPRNGKMIEKVKVTPANPGKIVCNIRNNPAPYEVCVNMLTGETTSRMLTVSTTGSPSGPILYGSSSSGVNGVVAGNLNSAPFAGPVVGNIGRSTSGILGGSSSGAFSASRAGSYANSNSGAFSAPRAGPYITPNSAVFSASKAGSSAISNSGAFSASRFGTYGNSNSAAFSASRSGTFGNSNAGSFSKSSFGTYNMPPIVYAGSNGAKPYATVTQVRNSDCFDDDTDVAEVDYSYPQMPADAVSLTLAYKNLRTPNVVYRQGKQFVPEDKLSFGHRTVPNEVKTDKKVVDIAEEKLVTVDKPIVELKIAPPRTVVIGSYDEREEAKLAELEAIERESITQEEIGDQVSDSLITYKDLGYAPVGAKYAKQTSYSEVINGDINDSAEVPCGPLGPTVPGYVPGSVIVQQEIINDAGDNSGVVNESMEILPLNPSRPCPQ